MGLEVCVHLTSRNMTTSQNFVVNTSLFCDADVIILTKRTQRSTYLTVVERSMYGVGVQREILLDDNVDYKVKRQVQHS